MFKKVGLPLLSLAGIGFCIFMIFYGSRKPPVAPVLFPPPVSLYENYIAGQGIVEAIYKNTPIGISFDELISDIYVTVGQVVKKGMPLFKLDTRALEAQLEIALTNQQVAQTDYENQTIQFSFYERLKCKSAVSEQVYEAALYAKKLAHDRLEAAKASVNAVKTDLERSISRAPVDGEVLQINIHIGQSLARFGQSSSTSSTTSTALILFGDTTTYHLRVDVDEEDAWRVIKGSPATAYVRGNSRIFIPLEFVYYEPYIIPKMSLSGSDLERVDTRVLQLVYKFPRDKYPVFAGQLLDVYIEAKPSEARV